MQGSTGYKKMLVLFGFVVALMLVSGSSVKAASGPMEITVLYDNYTLTEGCTADWGFACIIKGMEKCILFDAGTNGNVLLGNMDKLQVSARDVELVVISHDHLDHTGGLASFLGRNNNVTAYLPPTASAGLVQTVESRGATVQLPDEPVQICEGVHVAGLTIMGQVEQFLILETPKGLIVVTGCAHPGIVQIIQTAKQLLGKDIYMVFGGFHLLQLSDSAVMSIIHQFQSLGVQKVGASHCTGDRAIALFKQQYSEHFVPLGVGPLAIPVVFDFNGDGIVDFKDLSKLAQCWLQTEPSVDIGPTPVGDWIVDYKDLAVLTKHWLTDFRMIAHWKLDETEGSIAYDSVGDTDGTIHGEALWRPAGGQVDGALQLNGVDDYVSLDYALGAADFSFSVFTWIKGGAPGEVIISQADHRVGRTTQLGSTWLGADPSEGRLVTSLMSPAFGPLESQSVITDGQWHHVGLVCDLDGLHRHLYVDGAEVAKDTDVVGGVSSEGGLYFGAAKDLDATSLFCGLIDDVRIYNQALSAEEIEELAR